MDGDHRHRLVVRLLTSLVIVDIERHHAVFGSSGALLVTVLTGLALRRTVTA